MATTTGAPGVATITLTIDGKSVTVPRGTNLIEAARSIGITIPYLCYHHQLTAFGGCRLCLVEVEKVPKLLAACNTVATDGMVVRTTGEKVNSQRASTLEFILLNHPLDCPVCDKGGECELQDRTFEYSTGISRMTEPKVHVEDYDLGPLIVRNQDRCIICKRCIKVMEEIVGEPVLEFGQRGVSTEVYTFEHEAFRPGFSGNTIRVCPVGALMSKPFRFRARPWELQKTPGICSLCSVGCNLRQDVRENKLLRVVGLENPQVNDAWLCDRGQFGYDYIHSERRLNAPLVRRADGELEAVSWSEALELLATRLNSARAAGPDAFAALGSERTTNEDCYALQQFTRQVMGSPHLDHRPGGGRTDYQATRPRPGAIAALPEAGVVLVLGADITADAPVLDLVLKRSLLNGRLKLLIAHPRRTGLGKWAAQWLRYAPGGELALSLALCAAVLEGGGGEEAEPVRAGLAGRGVAELAAAAGAEVEAVRAAARVLIAGAPGHVLYGRAPAEARTGQQLVAALRNLALVSGLAAHPRHVLLEVVEQMNTWGARDLGVLPDTLPGGRPAPRPGMATTEILQAAAAGRLQALWIQGANPVAEFPEGDLARRALQSDTFVVVTDMFLTETARLADVVLPTVSLSERNGTLTNVEGRVQRTVRGMNPLGGARADWAILNMLSEEMGAPLGYSGEVALAREIRRVLDEAGEAPAPAGAQPVSLPAEPAVATTPEYPLRLYSGGQMFTRGTLQRESAVLPGLAPDPHVELHPADAAALGLGEGAAATVATALATVELPVRVSEETPAGSAYLPGGYCEPPLAALWPAGTHVTACRVAAA